ncbi:endothelin-converting enzyme 1-like [Rhipicephalus microplus]|uniref:endothelin-converting enzyme 1-like n=1 Tax=Rhipicephalus microplus TaxID=6941 RepID=UPI003F6BE66A
MRLTQFRAILTVSVTAVIVMAVVIVVLMPQRKETVPTEPYCETEDCFQHSYRLLAKLNHSLDPCEDFSAYVCSAWSPPQGYLEHSNSAMDDVRKLWFPAFSDMLSLGSKTIRVGLKPLAMYSSCMADHSVYGSNVKIFWEMLKECRLTWPEEPESLNNSALGVLMTLAFKWQFPLFFHVRALRLKSAPNWRFNMNPGSLIHLMYQHHVTVKNSGGYEKYWATFYYILSGRYNESAVNKTIIAKTKAIEGDVFKRLLAAMRSPVINPVLMPISETGLFTTSLSSEQWLRAFKETKLGPEVELKDEVFFGDAGFFLELAVVMNSYQDAELLSLIAWSFVQLMSPAVDYRLLENRYEQGITIYRPYFCERLVETTYQFLVVALHSASRFSPQERAFVINGFDNLVSAAVDMLNASEWLDVESRKLASAKLSSVRLQLWPPEKYIDSFILENMYAAFPSFEDSFAGYWAKSMHSAAEAYQPRSNMDLQSYMLNYALPYFLYDASSNTVKVSVGAVTAPLYYLSGTKAMFYGGLGFSIALQLVSSLDSQGLRWHPDGTFGGSFLSNTSARAFEMRDTCRSAAQNGSNGSAQNTLTALGRRKSVFPEIPALELAYIAYQRAVSDGSDSSPQGIPGAFSGDKVFFMTLCYMMCTLPDAVGPYTADCNKAMRNFEAFARAFHCPVGSQMNPRQKCAFFG